MKPIFTEDVPFGLLPLIEILERYEIPCPVNKAVAALAVSLSGIDLNERQRTLHSLGLEKLSNADLFCYLYEGKRERSVTWTRARPSFALI